MNKLEAQSVQGRILSCVGGLYTIETEDGTVKCKARGVFRKMGISPCAGDNVVCREGVIEEIRERRNSIIRPPLANLDRIFFVVSMCKPVPNYQLLDKFIAVARYKGIEPVLILTKIDLKSDEDIRRVYAGAELPIISVDYDRPETIDEVKRLISGKISAFTGNSGVGKSTLLNAIAPELSLQVNEISEHLGRGRHTTRQVTLYPVHGGYIADTPGFSTFETEQYAIIKKEELASCFPEFEPYRGECMFSDCAHICEKGCAVVASVNEGLIEKSRHESYKVMYDEAKKRKDWEK